MQNSCRDRDLEIHQGEATISYSDRRKLGCSWQLGLLEHSEYLFRGCCWNLVPFLASAVRCLDPALLTELRALRRKRDSHLDLQVSSATAAASARSSVRG